MNKSLIRIFSSLLILVVTYNCSFAVSSTTFSNSKSIPINSTGFNETEIYNAFNEIDDLMSYLSENDSTTYSDVKAQDNSLLSLVNDDTAISYNQHEKFSFNKQTAYLSGCIFGAIGIVLVAIINNGDQERLKSAIWGFVTTGCISLSTVLAVYIFYFSYFALYW